LANKLWARNDSVVSYARKVFAFVRDDPGKGAPFKRLDALAALQCGGSCTNKANLAAALLRARGIPARTVAHMPTWSTLPLYEHWLTEFWVPGTGWLALDPALGRWDPDRRTRVVLSVANSADENRAFEPLHERFVMPGAPYASVAELSKELYPADLAKDDGINTVEQAANLVVPVGMERKLFERALKALPAVMDGRADYGRMLAVVKSGKIGDVLALLTR
jgi:hypothetical protein